MYTLTVTNNFHYAATIHADVAYTVSTGATVKVKVPLGNAAVSIPGMGDMLVQDIGDRQIGGFSKATWGVFIAYQGEEAVFRYEGGGELTITITDLGQAKLDSNGGFSRVELNQLILPGE
jgi:carbon monoxide dehydrogenase subunit G